MIQNGYSEMKYQITRRSFLYKASLLTASNIITIPYLTACSSNKKIRFGVATDSHYADRAFSGKRYYKQSLQKMQEFVDVMNVENVDFIIHLGDFKDETPTKQETDTLNFLKDIEIIFSKFKGPRYHCIGNHDVDSITKKQFLEGIENTNIPNNKSYYSFNKNGFHFIVLDANYDANGKDHFFKEGADWQDTNIPTEQLSWLQNDLENNTLPTIIFCHHPFFEFYRDGYKYHINNYKQVRDLLKNKNVVACFHGHIHDERYKNIDGIHYITQFAMVDYNGLENNSFAIVEVNENTLNINGYKRVTNNKFSYS